MPVRAGLTGTFASSNGLIPGNGRPAPCGAAAGIVCVRAGTGGAVCRSCASDFQGAATEVLRLAASGDSHAKNIVASAGTALGAAIANLVNILDPETVVIGGGLGLAAGLYRESIEVALRAHVWSEFHRDLKIMSAQLGNDAGIVGAAALGNSSLLNRRRASCSSRKSLPIMRQSADTRRIGLRTGFAEEPSALLCLACGSDADAHLPAARRAGRHANRRCSPSAA